MSISKHKLSFDPSESDDYDVVKSYLSASDGTLISHTGGALDINIKSSDIQIEVDLDHIEDSVRLGDGTSFFTSTSENGDVALDVHLSNTSIEVTGTDFDIRDLSFASDSVDVSGSSVLVESGLNSCAYAAKSVAVTATDLITTELSGRKLITLQNVGSKDVYIGCDASVTTSNGMLLPKGATAEFPLGESINVHAISNGGVSEVRIMELA